MKISYLLILIGMSYILASDDTTMTAVRTIDYNTRYYVDMTQFNWGYLPAGFVYYFRIDAEEEDEMDIRLKVISSAYADFYVDVCAYRSYPDDYFIINNQNLCGTRLTYTEVENDGNYVELYYPFTTGLNTEYIAIRVEVRLALHYLSVYVYSSKGMALAILLVIIFLPCILVAAVVAYFLRRCGIIRIGVSSNTI